MWNIYGNILIVLTLMAFSLLIKACAGKDVVSAHNSEVSIRQLFLFYYPLSYRQNRKCSKHLPWPIFHSHRYPCRIFLSCLLDVQKCLPDSSPMIPCLFLFSSIWLFFLSFKNSFSLFLLPSLLHLFFLANNYWAHDVLDLKRKIPIVILEQKT